MWSIHILERFFKRNILCLCELVMPVWKPVSPDWSICSVLRRVLRVNTSFNELCRWIFAGPQGASLQILENRPQISRKIKRNNCGGKEGYGWRDNPTMHPVGWLFCGVKREQTNVFTGQLWQWPTRTLIASKSTDEQASQHTFKKKEKEKKLTLSVCVWFL